MPKRILLLSRLGRGALSAISTGLVVAAMSLGLVALGSHRAAAQEAEPNDFVPAPPGTNAVLGYYVYQHASSYNVARHSTVSDAGLEVNLGLARYVHWFAVGGLTAGYQIVQPFGVVGPGHIGSGPGSSLGTSDFGAGNTTLSAFIWPYNNPANKQYLILAGFVNPPVGSYDKTHALNVGAAGWSGEGQVAWDQGVGEHFSYDLAADVIAYGDTTGGGVKTSTNPAFRLQAWANWNFTPKFQTAIGWESILGGASYAQVSGGPSLATGAKGEFERLRLNASYFVLPNAQVMLELNHDFVEVGGFKQTFGATARFLYLF